MDTNMIHNATKQCRIYKKDHKCNQAASTISKPQPLTQPGQSKIDTHERFFKKMLSMMLQAALHCDDVVSSKVNQKPQTSPEILVFIHRNSISYARSDTMLPLSFVT